jgi:hypothetical protein
MEYRWYGLLIINVQSLGRAKPFIVGVSDGDRAVVDARTAGCTEVLVHIAG